MIERIKRETNLLLDPIIANAGLIYSEQGRTALARFYRQYIDIAQSKNLPLLLFSPTWRASYQRLCDADMRNFNINVDAVQFLVDIRKEYENYQNRIAIGGLLGCKNDAYRPDLALSVIAAQQFHSWQVEQLMQSQADFIITQTQPALTEAQGIARLLATSGKPYIIGFVINREGNILDGTPLFTAMEIIDNDVINPPLGYIVNCVHPNVMLAVMKNNDNSKRRLLGLLGNAADLSPDELDNAAQLHGDKPVNWVQKMIELRQYGLKIYGGCCGTDDRYIGYLAEAIAANKL